MNTLLATASFLLFVPCVVGAEDRQSNSITTTNPVELKTVNVIAVTPEQGGELPENLLPYNVHRADSEDFERAQALDATEYLDRRVPGVTINSAQANPLQPDLQFRGFTASPLLGGAEGVSVYVDGVRVNEVFGDTVNWDLIPEEAMERMSLLSGANPVFGLNTLGGTILIQTKNGFTNPGTQLESDAGSFGRTETTLAGGGNNGAWGWYALANHFEESGWRDLSNSNASAFLGTASWRSDQASLELHLTHAETKLSGNGPQSIEVLPLASHSVFTAPDRTQNFHSGLTAQGAYELNARVSWSGTLFARQVNTRSYNGDATDFARCDNNGNILCGDSSEPVLDQNGNPVPSHYNAVNNIGVRKQRSQGGSLQAIFKQNLFDMKNQFVAGVDLDHGRVNYSSVLEASYLAPFDGDRSYTFVTAANTGLFVPNDALTVRVRENSEGAYATDTLSVTDALALTFSARYNHIRTRIADAGGNNPNLDGDHAFHRINPAVGFTYQFNQAVNFYAGYSESNRAPTPVELTCASPNAPCKLPNDFLADPDLQQVVAHSFEAGLRGTITTRGNDTMHWQAGLFRTVNGHDILFQSTGGALSNEGFFANAGDTRRQGTEVSLNGKAFDQRLDWYANYARIDATFRTPFNEVSAHNPFADPRTGLVGVQRGDRIPGIPRNAVKVGTDWHVTPALTLGGDAVYNSAQYLRGDEANLLSPLGGYTTVNLRASYRAVGHVTLFARAQNIFNRHYANFGVLGDATQLYPDFTDPRFVSPGSPRAAWIGVRIEF